MGVTWKVRGQLFYPSEKALQGARRAFATVDSDGFLTEDDMTWGELSVAVALTKSTTLAHGLEAGPAIQALAKKAQRGWIDRLCLDQGVAERVDAGGKLRAIRPSPEPLANGPWFTRPQHPTRAYGAAISPDGQWLALAGATTSPGSGHADVIVWSREEMRPALRLAGLRKGIQAVAFDRTGKLVGAISTTGSGLVWDVATGKRQGRLKAHKSRPYVLVPGKGEFRVIETKHRTSTSSAHRNAYVDIEDAKLVVRSTTTQKVIRTLEASRLDLEAPTALAFGPDNWLAIVGETQVAIWNARTDELVHHTPAAFPRASRATWVPGEAQLATSKQEAGLHGVPLPCRLEGGKLVPTGETIDVPRAKRRSPRAVTESTSPLTTGRWFTRPQHPRAVQQCAITPDGQWLALASMAAAEVVVWSRETMETVTTLTGLRRGVVALSFDVSGRLIAGIGTTGSGLVWERASGQVVSKLKVKKSKPFVLVPGERTFTTIETKAKASTASRRGDLYADLAGAVVEVRSVSDRRVVATFPAYDNGLGECPHALAFGPRPWLAMVFESWTAIWNYETGDYRAHRPEPFERVTRPVWVVGEASLAAGSAARHPLALALPCRIEEGALIPSGMAKEAVSAERNRLAELERKGRWLTYRERRDAEPILQAHPAKLEWTLRETESSVTGVRLSEDQVVWYTDSKGSPHGSHGASQSFEAFLDGGPDGHVRDDILAELYDAVRFLAQVSSG